MKTPKALREAEALFQALAFIFSDSEQATKHRNVWQMRSMAHDAWLAAGGSSAEGIGSDPLNEKTLGAIYKVRNKVTGLYSEGGYYARFKTRGKVWQTRGALMGSLRQVRGLAMENLEIVEVKTIETRTESVVKALDEADRRRRGTPLIVDSIDHSALLAQASGWNTD